MLYKYRFTLLFYSILATVFVLLLVKTELALSISYKEAVNLFINHSILSVITNASTFLFGDNDLALRTPFIILYLLSVILMYLITENYFKYEKDRFISIILFMALPGVLSASLLVNTAIITTFFTLLYIYYYEKKRKHLYYLLPFLLFVDNAFAILFLALFLFSLRSKDKKLLYFSLVLFFLSIFIYGFSTDGRPRGYFLDTFGIYATIFSPLVFLYFIYALYRSAILRDRSLTWYISITALLLSILISFRQRVFIEDFAPFVVIATPIMVKMFLNSYRVRLKEFRKTYNLIASVTIILLFLNVLFTFISKPLYLVLSEPRKHFVYQYHFAKELAHELKTRDIDYVYFEDSELALRQRFYGIKEGTSYYLSNSEFYNYDEKIVISYYSKELFSVYIKKL